MSLKGKKLLLLGGSNSTDDIRRFAGENGVILAATAPLKYGDTPLKRIAAEAYETDASDTEGLVRLVSEAHIDGIFPGNNEDIMPHAIAAAEATGLPCYSSTESWDRCANKAKFKAMCRQNGIPVAGEYDLGRTNAGDILYPVVVKPADSCGSQGFSICHRPEELDPAVEKALPFSRTGTVLVEDFVPYDAAIIHYTLAGGEAMFCGISDKKSMLLGSDGGSVMALQIFPSVNTAEYLATLHRKASRMFLDAGMHDGPVWIEAFNNSGHFIFNEMGYRFGGSMTYHPIRYFYGVDQLEFMLRYALGEEPDLRRHNSLIRHDRPAGKKYSILPLHVRPGIIERIVGADEVKAMPEVYAYVPIHGEGDHIRGTGTVQQVFCYLHLLCDDMDDLSRTVSVICTKLKVYNENSENILFRLYNF